MRNYGGSNPGLRAEALFPPQVTRRRGGAVVSRTWKGGESQVEKTVLKGEVGLCLRT